MQKLYVFPILRKEKKISRKWWRGVEVGAGALLAPFSYGTDIEIKV